MDNVPSNSGTKHLSYAFPFATPEDITRYELLAPTPITFGSDAGIISGRQADLNLQIVPADPEAKAFCDRYCAEALAKITHNETTSERVRILFATSPGGLPTARETAILLNLSLRTLQRLLFLEGSSFQRLVASFRREQACALLAQGIESKRISYLLGFKDIGSFRRAFHIWTGQAPSHWRQNTDSL